MEPNSYYAHESARLLERLASLNGARDAVRRASGHLDVEVEVAERCLKAADPAAYETYRATRLDPSGRVSPQDVVARLQARAALQRAVEEPRHAD